MEREISNTSGSGERQSCSTCFFTETSMGVLRRGGDGARGLRLCPVRILTASAFTIRDGRQPILVTGAASGSLDLRLKLLSLCER